MHLVVVTSVGEVANIDVLILHERLVHMLTIVLPEFKLHLGGNLWILTE